MDIYDYADTIETKQDFIKFLDMLSHDLLEDPNSWENDRLNDFLQGIYGFTLGIEGYFKNTDQNINSKIPTWRIFANILLGGKVHG